MNIVLVFIFFLVALVVREWLVFYIFDKLKQYAAIKGMIAYNITYHKDFLLHDSEKFDQNYTIEARKNFLRLASEIDRFLTMWHPFLLGIPKRSELKDTVYFFVALSKDSSKKKDLLRRIERIHRLEPSQIN